MSSKLFTKEDEILLDYLVGYKTILNYIQGESMKITKNITNDNIIPHFSKVQLIDNETKKEETVPMSPIGDLNDNTFYWFHPNIRALFYDTAEHFIKTFKIDKVIANTILKFFKDDKIEFSEKYRDSIACFISIMYDPRQANVVRYLKEKKGDYEYFFIHVKLPIPQILAERILTDFIYLNKKI
jgi:hypothetical protein